MGATKVKLILDQPKTQEVFDVGNWLDRATSVREAPRPAYVPRHRAEGPAR